jgi:hypothetical protein
MSLRLIQAKGEPYLARWTILSTPFFSIKLHYILASDPDRELHDHPWWFVSLVLAGGYWEYFQGCEQDSKVIVGSDGAARFQQSKPAKWRRRFSVVFRRANFAHRVILDPKGYAVTLVLTGPATRTWGFLCRDGWKPWDQFEANGGCNG